MIRIVLFLFCSFSLLPNMCESKRTEIDDKILKVFSDFSYVGSGSAKLNQDGSLDPLTPAIPHEKNEQPMPSRLQIGVLYIFHHRAPVENESLGVREFPQRLSNLGYKIIRSPESGESMMQLIYGGPLFRIEFSDGNHTGEIFNGVHMNLGDPWNDHDYYLVYLR